jgi:chromosome segregation ATPase
LQKALDTGKIVCYNDSSDIWGEVNFMEQTLQQILQVVTGYESRFERLDERLGGVEERLGGLERDLAEFKSDTAAQFEGLERDLAEFKSDTAARFKVIDGRLGGLERDLAEFKSDTAEKFDEVLEELDLLKEHAEITRGATNALVEWAQEAGSNVYVPFPIERG